MNHLKDEKSPYLIQHRENPVDWYPWGEEAFGKALREQKPVFLSIGYSTCHWCHVMAHESFEDTELRAGQGGPGGASGCGYGVYDRVSGADRRRRLADDGSYDAG